MIYNKSFQKYAKKTMALDFLKKKASETIQLCI